MPSQSEVNEVFSSVAQHYDLMNDLMSFGLHRLWKEKMCSKITRKNGSLLDVAGGTGDIALRAFLKNKSLKVTVCDVNPSMLNAGRDKVINSGCIEIDWVCASAESLPFPDNSFDYYTIAFGIRNIPDRKKALSEAHRVLKKCGQFLCMEFSPISDDSMFQAAYDLYSFCIIPNIGKFVVGNSDPYSYLVDSIRSFPSQEDFAREISEAGLFKVSSDYVCCKVVSIYSAWKV